MVRFARKQRRHFMKEDYLIPASALNVGAVTHPDS
jgi:hypothetical protein